MSKIVKIAITLLLIAAPASAEDGRLEVQFKNMVTMEEETLLVKDLVDTDNTDIEFVSRYGNLKITDLSPEADKIDQTKLIGVLITAGADIDQIMFKQGSAVKLERGQEIELTDDQSARLIAAVTGDYNVPAKDIAIESARILPKLEELALDGFKFAGIKAKDLSDLRHAKFIASVEDFDGNRTAHTVTLKLKIETPVITAAADITAGEGLTDTHYFAGRMPLDSLNGRLVSATEIKGKAIKATTEIKKGEVLTADLVKESKLIKEGSAVTLSYKTSLLNIKAQGTLLEAGEIGAEVRVENADSKRTVLGRLISQDVVEVANAN